MRTRAIGEGEIPGFVDLSFRLHGNDPLWVPPLRQVLMRELSGQGSFARYGKQRLFLCESAGEIAGRIAAIINPRLTGPGGLVIGQVGYFECIDDTSVARSLFAEALEWLVTQGIRQVRGPMNGGAHRLHRLMISGFEHAPFLFEPRNPPYYARLFELQGFTRVRSWQSFEADLDLLAALLEAKGLQRAVTRASRRYHVELLDPSETMATLARLHRLLDGVWAGHTGYASIDLDEMAEVFGGVLSLINRRHIGVVVDAQGKDLGAAFMYPDDVDEARRLQGDASGWGHWVAQRQPQRVVLHTLAFLPEARGRGAPLLAVDLALRHLREDGVREIVVGLVDEAFGLFHSVLVPTREYALYGRSIA